MLCFKFHKNRAINENFDFWRGQNLSGGPEEGRATGFHKIEKDSYRTVVSTQNENFSIIALLDSVQKSWELNRLLGGFRFPKGWTGVRFQKIEKSPHRTVVRTRSKNISTLTQLENV